jgi:hypothetical protein
MNKTLKIIGYFLIFDILVVAGYFAYKTLLGGKSGSKPEDYEWVTIDENYATQNYVEEFIKNDAAQKGIFPVYIRNYGKDPGVLKRFVGTNFARPTEARVSMMYKGLDDWMLIDLKYKNEKDMEVLRTILYVEIKGTWQVGDSGKLLK